MPVEWIIDVETRMWKMQYGFKQHNAQESGSGQAGRFAYPPSAVMHMQDDYRHYSGSGHPRPGFFIFPLLFLTFLFVGGWKLIFPLLFIGFVVVPFLFFMRGGKHGHWGRGGWGQGHKHGHHQWGKGWGHGWQGKHWGQGRWGWDDDEEKPKRKTDDSDDDKPKRDDNTLYV
jgi:hypothetical protein